MFTTRGWKANQHKRCFRSHRLHHARKSRVLCVRELTFFSIRAFIHRHGAILDNLNFPPAGSEGGELQHHGILEGGRCQDKRELTLSF
jgi:hypothetical protein